MERPKVGVAVAIRLGGDVLLGLRQGGHAPGMWGFPGGHLEGGESFEACVIRETREETSIKLPSATLWTVENVIFDPENKHFVTIFLVADMPTGQHANNMEPAKCKKWAWFPWSNLPSPVMPGIEQLLRRGLTPFEIGRGAHKLTGSSSHAII